MVYLEAFKKGMSLLAGAVNVIATAGDGGKAGLTATAVCSVTDTPPSLLVCVNTNGGAFDIIKENGIFSVNVLSKEQESISNRFAGYDKVEMNDRFITENWDYKSFAAPILNDALVNFVCKISSIEVVGTHGVVIGEIVAVSTMEEDNMPAPLLYFNKSYGSFQ